MSALYALAASAAGVTAAGFAPLLGQAAAPNLVPYVQAGGSATAVGGLVYVAKLLVDGRLVAAPVNQLLESAERQAERLAELVDKSHQREKELRDLIFAERQRRD